MHTYTYSSWMNLEICLILAINTHTSLNFGKQYWNVSLHCVVLDLRQADRLIPLQSTVMQNLDSPYYEVFIPTLVYGIRWQCYFVPGLSLLMWLGTGWTTHEARDWVVRLSDLSQDNINSGLVGLSIAYNFVLRFLSVINIDLVETVANEAASLSISSMSISV